MSDKLNGLDKLWAMDIDELRKLDRNQVNALARELKITPGDINQLINEDQFNKDLREMVSDETFLLRLYGPPSYD